MQKTTFKTRLLALLTAAFMIVMCVPFAAFAADVNSVTIYWNAEDGIPQYTSKTNGNVEAPDAGNGYCWKDNMKNGEPVYVNSGDVVNWADLAANAGSVDAEGNGFYSFVKVEKPAAPKKNFNVTFTVDPEKGSFTEYGAGPVEFKGDEDVDGDQQYKIPAVTAKPGYKFVGWKGQGASEIAWDADVKTFGVTGLCFYENGKDEGYASIEAVFEKVEPAPKKNFNVTFTVDPEKGSFTEYGAGPVEFKGDEDVDGDQQYKIPAVTAKPGYKFVGWKGQGASEIAWDADVKTFGVTGLCFYENGKDEGYASIEAVFEKVEPAPKKNFNVTFTVDPEKGSFTEYGAGPVEFKGDEDVDGDQQYKIPAVTAKPGYKFVGWKGQGASEIAWDADVKTFGVTGLCFYENGKDEGYASIEAVFEPTVKLTDIKVNFLKEDGKTVVCNAQYIAKDATLVLPYDVEGVTGWKLANNLTTYDVKTKFSFNDLAAFVGTNYAADGTANLTFYAQYKQDVKTDSTSTSSSSSNTTTTAASQQQVVKAASQQQVVKAAAAPANTTKVLPKTGATNAAPLIGGSLAVVALLMGYGVYGLVLRKKD